MLAIREHRLAGKQVIEEQARRQVRTFLDELKNGTRNYRTVASLGGQVAQEYRGRAILELLQNAHDVLAFADDDDSRRISFVLRSSPEPELLVANSGRPFRHEDFSGICQLAQSPKDPNESVGNKGLGFQSVLELSTRPEVWSTTATGGDAAFTFGFDPGVREPIGRVAQQLLNGDRPTDLESGAEQVVDWSPGQIEEYRRRLLLDRIDPVTEVNTYLSPYVVPRFLDDPPPEVARLLEEGHVTVIRLPLDGGKTGSRDNAVESVRQQLKALDEAAMVFLGHLSVLRISIDDNHTELKRETESELPFPAEATRRERLRVSRSKTDASDATERSFHVWSRIVGGKDQQPEKERIAAAVRHLPNRWPEVRKVEVAVAVEETEEAREGVFVIFLPTKMKTGVGAHINAPFYGSLDRTRIDLGDEYNDLLLEFVTDLVLDATIELVKCDPKSWRGRAVIDLVAGATDSHAFDKTRSFTDRIRQRASDQDRPLDDLALILCDDGWRLPGVARTMPVIPNDDPLGGAVWRSQAGFTLASSALDARSEAVEALLQSFGGSASPLPKEWARAVAEVAGKIAENQVEVTWNNFLSSVLTVLPRALWSQPRAPDTDHLREASFLPTDDGRLLSASEETQIFFRPRRGADDAADFVGSIPESLRERIAFLHPGVRTHEGPQRRNTEVQKFLEGRFVQRFRREDLLRDVVIPSLPELPATHGSRDAAACAETLRWTLKMIGREEQESLVPLLSRLPVACVGGWFAMKEAVFGPGWDGRCGDHLKTLADALPARAADRLMRTALLPPRDTRWGFVTGAGQPDSETLDVSVWGDLYARAGVVDGFRLDTHEAIRFEMSRADLQLPREAPSGIPQSAWEDWKDAARGQLNLGYAGSFEYELRGIKLLPVDDLLHHGDVADAARQALAELILASLAHWKEGWGEVTIRKTEGWSWSGRVTSPLRWWLSTLPWLDIGSVGAQPVQQAPQPLRQRWLVPAALLRGQPARFRHLFPLSSQLAQRLAQDEVLLAALEKLGLNVYPTEDALTGPDLLNALADVAAEAPGDTPPGGFDVFLGQVRHAWRHFDPDRERELPKRFLVRTAPRTFTVRSGTELGDVYLPDHSANTRSLREHRQSILAMRPVEANGDVGARLYDDLGVRRASGLEERCLIDGVSGIDPAEGARGLDAAGLGWLPVVLLTLAAQGGTNPRGPATDAWQEAAARLRRVRVRRCHSIAVELVDEGRADEGGTVASSQPRAHWLSRDHILLLNREVAESASYDEMAAAFQAMLDRQDLLKDLRLVMGSLAGEQQPTRVQIAKALERAEIDAETVADIRLRWGGTTMLLGRIRPVVKLLDVSDVDLDAAATDTEGLAKWLSASVARWPSEDLMAAARECYDDFEMGLRALQVLGADAELPMWNKALRELGGEYTPVTNARARYQATRYLEEAARWLRAFARHVATKANDQLTPDEQAELFSKINAVHEGIQSTAQWRRLCEEWSTQWWEVPFRAVHEVLCEQYAAIPQAKSHIDAIQHARNIEGLLSALKREQITLEPDPLVLARRNWRHVNRVIRSVWQLYQAWLRKERPDSQIPPAPELQLDSSMYLREWSEAVALDRATRETGNEDFIKACANCMTIERMREELGLPEPTTGPSGRRKDGGEKRRRATILIGDTIEVGGPETYSVVFGQLEDLAEPTGPQAHLDEVTALTDPPPSRSSGGGGHRPIGEAGRTGGKTAQMYASPHVPELVGIVGEMQAFRFLRSKFGIDEHAWVSEFRTKVLSLREGERDETSDSHGYDFRFAYRGKTWCVEVKATTGDGTSFQLTSGEMAAASRIAVRKDERWRILRVRNALSEQPDCDWLPNPFEPGAGERLRLREGSMIVEYTPSKLVEEHHG